MSKQLIDNITGCVRLGVYGTNCDQPCSNNCKDNTCHIENGTCFECKPGWTGIYCKTSMALFRMQLITSSRSNISLWWMCGE